MRSGHKVYIVATLLLKPAQVHGKLFNSHVRSQTLMADLPVLAEAALQVAVRKKNSARAVGAGDDRLLTEMGKGLCNTHRSTRAAAAPFALEPVYAAVPRAEPAGSGKRHESFGAPVKLASCKKYMIAGHSVTLLSALPALYQPLVHASISGRTKVQKHT